MNIFALFLPGGTLSSKVWRIWPESEIIPPPLPSGTRKGNLDPVGSMEISYLCIRIYLLATMLIIKIYASFSAVVLIYALFGNNAILMCSFLLARVICAMIAAMILPSEKQSLTLVLIGWWINPPFFKKLFSQRKLGIFQPRLSLDTPM